MLTEIYCPGTEHCSIHCAADADAPCGRDIDAFPTKVYLSDPDSLYDDSPLSISCESGDCAIQHYFCRNISDITTCIHPLSTIPLTCDTTDSECNVCSLSFAK